MKRLLGALALVALAALPSWGALTSAQSFMYPNGPGIPNKTVDGRKPIAVVTNNEWEDATLYNTFYKTQNAAYGRLWSLLKEQGQQVDFFDSGMFRPLPGASTADSQAVFNTWRYLGDKYACVIVRDIHYLYTGRYGFLGRFFCPDSTNAQIIQAGTVAELSDYNDPAYMMGTGCRQMGSNDPNNNQTVTGAADGLGFAFTTASGDTLFSSIALMGSAAYAYPNLPGGSITVSGQMDGGIKFHPDTPAQLAGFATAATRQFRRAVKVAGTASFVGTQYVNAATDTTIDSWYNVGGSSLSGGSLTLRIGAAPDSTHWNVSKVVQLYRPPSSGTFNAVANVYYQCNKDSLSKYYADSVATYASEALPISWRTYWNPPGQAPSDGTHLADIPWLRGRSTSGWVDYWPHLSTVTNSTGAYSSMYLYALIARYAKLDPIKIAYEWDSPGVFGVNAVTDSSTYYQPQWPSADTLKAFHDYVVSQGVPADFPMGSPPDSLYAKINTSQAGYQYPFLKGHSFVASNRDTNFTHPYAAPIGIAQPGSLPIDTYAGAVGTTHRVAFNRSASGTYNAWGIYQRISMSDSAYSATGIGKVVPYLSFPHDYSLNLDSRPASNGNGRCPPDSQFLAMRLAGKRYVRGWTSNLNPFPVGNSPNSGVNWACVGVTDSTSRAATRYFSGPDQFYDMCVPSGWSSATDVGLKMRVRCIGAAAFTEPPIYNVANAGTQPLKPTSRNRYPFEATVKLATLLGITTPVAHAYNPQDQYGEAALGSGYSTGYVTSRSSDVGRVRMANQAPQYLEFASTNVWRGYPAAKDHARIAIFDPLRALANIAGHPIHKWVNPWQVYDK